MRIEPVLFWTDILIYLLIITTVVAFVWSRKQPHWRGPWRRVGERKLGMMAAVLLLTYSVVGILDSIHFRIHYAQPDVDRVSGQVQSVLDLLISPLGHQDERTYSAPFAIYSMEKATALVQGVITTYHPRLVYGGAHLKSLADKKSDIIKRSLTAIAWGFSLSLILGSLFVYFFTKKSASTFKKTVIQIFNGHTILAWREVLLTGTLVIMTIVFIKSLSPYYHLLGTNKIGGDILYESIKSIRTGLIIGTLTTLIMLPFAILLGTQAGYYGGWRDDIIQYIYITLSSVPGVLLISAAVLSLQIFIANHPSLFTTLESRADARLLALCLILGITSWTSLCRLLRAETLKLREMDYVKAAYTMGVRQIKIILQHVIPNVMHIIIITIVLDFSSLVLAEAVLSYVGVGVDPVTPSWGNMINSARLDLARDPVVWWPLFSAFLFMFVLVLSANLFADAVQNAFDPRTRNEA